MYNINYENIFTLIMKFNTLCIFLILIALKDLECHQININNVFIKSFLKKTIYIILSLKIITISNYTLYILHSLYDLKQAVKD